MKKTIFAAVISSVLPSQAWSENCRALPMGAERKACAMREDPERFQARVEKCQQLALARGDTRHTGTGAGGMREFVRDCMRGKQR